MAYVEGPADAGMFAGRIFRLYSIEGRLLSLGDCPNAKRTPPTHLITRLPADARGTWRFPCWRSQHPSTVMYVAFLLLYTRSGIQLVAESSWIHANSVSANPPRGFSFWRKLPMPLYAVVSEQRTGWPRG